MQIADDLVECWFDNLVQRDTGNVKRSRFYGNAESTQGRWNKGDEVIDVNPAASGKIGWVCITAGIAGSTAVFKQFGVIDP